MAPEWAPNFLFVLLVCAALMLSSSAWLGLLWKRPAKSNSRYVAAFLIGLPKYLLSEPGLGLVLACLAGEKLGLPGFRWLAAVTRYLARHHDVTVVTAAAYGYDYRMLQDHEKEARAWLVEAQASCTAKGWGITVQVASALRELGHKSAAKRWLIEALETQKIERSDIPAATHLVAWMLYADGEPERARFFAQRATELSPEDPGALDTLGRVLLTLGEPTEAAAHLQSSVDRRANTGTRIALAQATALLGRPAEAVNLAAMALREHRGPWPSEEPPRKSIRKWMRDWQTQ